MNKKITILEFLILIYFAIRSSLTGISGMLLASSAGESAWISLILGVILGIVPLLLFFYIASYKPDLNIFEKNKKLCGKFGNVINILLIGVVFLFCLVIFYDLSNFIYSQFLNKTPPLFIALLFAIAIIYTLNKGLNTMSRSFVILFFICITLYLVSVLGIIPQFELDNLKPLYKNNILGILKGALYYIGYNILPIFLLTVIPKNKIENPEKVFKYVSLIYLITAIIELLVFFLIIGTLGLQLVMLYQYPEFHILKKISYFTFIDRLESTLALQWIINFYCFITLGSYFITTGIKETFKIKNKSLIILITILSLTIGQNYIFNGNTEANIFLSEVFIFILYIGLFLIPLILAIKKRCSKASFN